MRSPLGIVRGALTEHDDAPAALRERLLVLASRAATQLDVMSTRLSLLGRLQATTSANRAPCDLVQLAQEAVKEVATTRARRTIDVKLEGFDTPCPIDAEPALVLRACAELCDNAVRFATKTVTLTIRSEPKSASFIARNDGPAADPAELAAAFDRSMPLTNHSGLGIGLWLATTIAELHGGSVRPTADDDAVSFVLSLPRDSS